MLLRSPASLLEFRRRIPTTDLYVLNPVRHLARREPAARLPLVRYLAPNIYAIGRTAIIVRYGSARDLDRLRHGAVDRIIYVADDDFVAGAEDPNLPDHYRAKLAAFAAGAWPLLREAADTVIVPGRALQAIYGSKARIIEPAWHRPPADTGHFTRTRRFDIVHLGTGSHRSDVEWLAPVLAGVLGAHRNARLTLFSLPPPELKGHPQVHVRRATSWWRYRLALPRMRFHLALYPLQDTPFNAARSANKLFEHAIVGAAPLMTPNDALRRAGDGVAGLFVEGGEADWRARIAGDLEDNGSCRQRAEAVRSRLLASDPLDVAARAWREILAPEM